MSDQPKPSFNLLHEPWIPVRWLDGGTEEVSLSTALHEAAAIREIEGDIPQQVLPIIRLMLAILYHGAPPADSISQMEDLWARQWREGAFDVRALDTYLGEVDGLFDLLDVKHPFYQVGGLEYVKGDCDPVDELVADVPKQDKYLFSMRDKGRVSDLSLAESARWLIFQQAYSTAGIKTPVRGNTHVNKGKVYAPKGAIGTGLLGAEGPVYLEGANLFQTLMLNMVLFDEQAHGRIFGNETDFASWERDIPTPDTVLVSLDRPNGPVDAFTWQSRRMRLVVNGNRVIGVVSCYGDIVSSMADRQNAETMTSWRQQKQAGTAYIPLVPRPHNPSRAIWRGLASMVATGADVDRRPGVIRWVERLELDGILGSGDLPSVVVHAQGIAYGTQNSVFVDGIDDAMRISRSLVRHESSACTQAVSVVAQIDEAVNRYCAFLRNVWRAAGRKTSGSRAQVQAINTVCDKEREAAYSGLDELCRERIAEFPDEDEAALEYANLWRSEVHQRILAMADDYGRSMGGSVFQEHEGMTVGRASMALRKDLVRILGPLSVKRQEGSE